MSAAPSWLSDENVSTATTMQHNPTAKAVAGWAASSDIEKGTKPEKPPKNSTAVSDTRRASVADDVLDVDPAELLSMKRWHLALRILYMAASIFLATAAALSLQNQTDLGLVFFAFYVLFFSAIICCFEVGMSAISRMIAVNFGFMYTLSGRLIFLILAGFMAFLLSVLGKVAMGALYGVLLFHAFIMYKFPKFEQYLRKKHYYEGAEAEKNAGTM